MATEKLTTSKGQSWFGTTGLPSDIVIEVDDISFHLHRVLFPLMSRSRKLHTLTAEQENPRRRRRSPASAAEAEEEEEIKEEEEQCLISLPEFPGIGDGRAGPEFCYGVQMELTAANVAPLRCSGEYLEMTEEFAEDNLISKTERLLSQSVLRNIQDSIKTLKSCEQLIPMA